MILKLFSLFKRVKKVDIVKVFAFTAVSTLLRMLTALISVKVVAVIIGPSGIALLGQLNNFSSVIMTIASGGINSGITKYIAEFNESEEKIKILLSTAFKITLGCSLVIGLLMILFHSFLSNIILLSSEYGYIFVVFGLTVVLYALNLMFASILNGYKEFKRFVLVNMAGSILGLIFTLSLVFVFGLPGALLSVVTFQSIMLFVSLWMIRKLPWMSWGYFKKKFDNGIAKKYFKYTLMALTTALTAPIAQLVLRSYVMSEISVTEAGWWESMNRISNMYLMVITSSFSVYYLPRLSELNTRNELRQEIFKAYKVIIPVLVFGLSSIYLLRFVIIDILFSREFEPMARLFFWQLLGDFFKISSWLLAFLMIAKSMTKMFISTEIIFSLIFVGLAFWFMQFNGLVGIVQAYFVNYVLYTLSMILCFKKILFK